MKKETVKVIVIFLFFVLVSLFCTVFGNDEIWNYGFAMSIYRGLIPYRDFSMVITPLYPFIISLFFHVFGPNEIVMQISNSLFLAVAFIFLDKIVGNKKYLVLLFLVFPLSITFPSYNIFLFVLFVILLYCEKYNKSDYLIGLLLGLLFITKQTVGGCIFLVGILFYFKNYRKVVKRLIGFFLPIIVLCIYLVANKSFYYFIDFCFLGLFDFGNKNLSTPFIMTCIFLFLIINALYYIKKNPKSIFNYYILAFYSIMIPLIDIYHVQVAFLAFIVLNMYNLGIPNKYDKYIRLFSCLTAICVSVIVFISLHPYTFPNDINHFEYRLIPNKSIAFTKQVNEYISKHSDKDIYFLAADAYYFKIINDKDIEKLDLINNGNWGYNGSKKIIDEIKKHKDALFVIYDVDFNEDSQIDKGALYYITDNCKKIDEIGIYDVYSFED